SRALAVPQPSRPGARPASAGAVRGRRQPDPRPPSRRPAGPRGDAPVTIDVVCAGAPFLDLVFRGLPRIPEPGEEALASDVVIGPWAMGNVAYALRRLGLDAVVCAPIGTDPAGRFLKQLMDDAGIPWLGEPTPTTPVSVGLPLDGDRAFVTVHPN